MIGPLIPIHSTTESEIFANNHVSLSAFEFGAILVYFPLSLSSFGSQLTRHPCINEMKVQTQ